MFKLFKKKNIELLAMIDGVMIDLVSVNDPTFSKKLLGEGIAIIPSSNLIVAPESGEVIVLPETKHAVGIKLNDGTEVLIHIGIDTVHLKGKGFVSLVEVGTLIKKGEPLIQFDSNYLNDLNLDMVTMMIILNKDNNLIKINESVKNVIANQNVVISIG